MIKIALLPGDGIGQEIVQASLVVLNKVCKKYNLEYSTEKGLFGGTAFDNYGTPFPEETWEIIKKSDAVLLGAVGGPKWDNLERTKRPEFALLEIRKRLGLYCNLRPIKFYPVLASKVAWKEEMVKNVDFIILRELTGGAYFGKKGKELNKAFDTIEYSKREIERLVRRGFDLAKKRKKILHSIDKANILETSRLWREVVEEVSQEYQDIKVNHLYVDNAAFQMVINPTQFDVIVTENMFGDILSDQGAALAGSLGMLPSASLGGEINLYEPVHGSAPDIAGEDKANPLATILSLALMLRFTFKNEQAAQDIENAVGKVLNEGFATVDIANANSRLVGTKEMAKLIANIIQIGDVS